MGQEIIHLQVLLGQVWDGDPWFGRCVAMILGEVRESEVHYKPHPKSHSQIELVYHLLSWTDLTRRWIGSPPFPDPAFIAAVDWIELDPAVHGWDQGVSALERGQREIIQLLEGRDDTFLDQGVPGRNYNFRTLLHGQVHHLIYHLGQIAYLNTLIR